MAVCTFFGHRECYDLDTDRLQSIIEELITKGVDTFYVGNQGRFDTLALLCLEKLKVKYPHISYSVVLAYLPTHRLEHDLYGDCSIYPEGLEEGSARFAIERRNRWMISYADYCICGIDHTWGGAYKFACLAKRKGLILFNIYNKFIEIS